jgi:hypothetical protein
VHVILSKCKPQNLFKIGKFTPCLQIHIYLPHTSLPIYGIVRVVLKDSDDSEEQQQSFLDSDGFVGDALRRVPLPHAHVNDGLWHMITVATLPPGSQCVPVWRNMYLVPAPATLSFVVRTCCVPF